MQRTRTHSKLPESVHHQLNSYALAASAAGVGFLALTQPAEAKIVYTKAHHDIKAKHSYKLDFNRDGIADVSIVSRFGCNQDYCVDYLYAVGANGNGIEGAPGFLGIPYAYAVNQGAQIGPKQPFTGKLMASYGMGSIGQWVNVTDRYLGVKFQIKGKTHYGWARFSVSLNVDKFDALLTGYAYETVANKPIIAGKTKGPNVITVESTSLGHLARGASVR